MANKYLKVGAGGLHEEVEGTVTSAGAGDAGKIPALGAAGRLDETLMPVGIGADTAVLVASENLAAGDFVSVWDDVGTAKVRKSDASDSAKRANGFVLAAVTLGENATVYFEGTNTQLSGLTAGDVWLSTTTPGDVQQTVPTGSGNIIQRLGVAVSPTAMNVELSSPVKLA